MAPKRPTPLEDPPSASSSDEEEVASDNDVVASDDEVEEEVPHAEEAELEDEEDEEEEEEEEMAVNGAPAVPKPVAQRESPDSDESGDDLPVVMKQKTSKHVDDEKKKKASSKMETVVQKPVVEHESSDSDETDDSQLNSGTVKPVDAVNPAAKPIEKERVLVTNGKKRKKSESELTECEEKKPGEDSKKHRVFGGESEEELLKGMAYFVSKNGKDIMADQDGFYEYLKKELDVEFSKAQLITKARNLKKKFKKNDEKVKNGEELKPREHNLYELSKIIWDAGELSNGRSHVSKEEQIVMFEKKDEVSDYEMDDTESDDTESDDTTMNHLVELLSKVGSGFGLSEEYVRRGLSLIGKTERIKMAKQWEKLLIDENELMLKRLELHQEQVKLALDALRASSH